MCISKRFISKRWVIILECEGQHPFLPSQDSFRLCPLTFRRTKQRLISCNLQETRSYLLVSLLSGQFLLQPADNYTLHRARGERSIINAQEAFICSIHSSLCYSPSVKHKQYFLFKCHWMTHMFSFTIFSLVILHTFTHADTLQRKHWGSDTVREFIIDFFILQKEYQLLINLLSIIIVLNLDDTEAAHRFFEDLHDHQIKFYWFLTL